MDEIEDKVDQATSDIRNTNVRLKETIFKVINSCFNSLLVTFHMHA